MEIIKTQALISINATFIIQMLSFLIFVFCFNRVMLRPINGVIQRRNDYMGKLKTEISVARKTWDDFNADLEKQKQAIRTEAFKVNEEKEVVAAGEAVRLIAAARKEFIELSQAAEKDVARQLTEAQKYFEEETRSISIIMMEQIMGRKIN